MSASRRIAWASAFAVTFALAGPASVRAQGTAIPVPPPQNVAQLSASGSVEVAQDLLVMTLSATREGTDANLVQTQLKQALETALAEARRSAAPGQMDVRTGNFSLYPRNNKDGKISGWQGSATLVLDGKDFQRIATTAGRIQTMTMAGTSFGLSREQRAKVEGEAQAQAIERFKARASEISRNFGFASYTLREVSINSSEQGGVPRPRMMAMEAKASADSPVPVEAGKTTVVVEVSGSVQMQ